VTKQTVHRKYGRRLGRRWCSSASPTRLAHRGRAHRARPHHDQARARATDPVRGGCLGGSAAHRDPRPVPAGEL